MTKNHSDLEQRKTAFAEEISRESTRLKEEKIKALIGKLPDKKPTFFEQICKPSSISSYALWDIIVFWRDNIFFSVFSRVSKKNYLSAMLKLIEEGIIDPYMPLSKLSQEWYQHAKTKIDNIDSWSVATKGSRKSCLRSFFDFATEFNPDNFIEDYAEPYSRKPSMIEISYLLSSIEDRSKMHNFDLTKLYQVLFSINEREALIFCIMVFTGRKLDEILNIKKDDVGHASIDFINETDVIPEDLATRLKKCKKDSAYLFVTSNGNPLKRNQFIRTLKTASKLMNLDFEVSPRLLQSKALLSMCREKISPLEKLLGK
jgi:integrase